MQNQLFFYNKHMLTICATFLSITDVQNFMLINSDTKKHIKNNKIICKQMTTNLIQKYYNFIINKEKNNESFFKKHLRTKQCLHDCLVIRGPKDIEFCPFHYPYIIFENNLTRHFHIKSKDIIKNKYNTSKENIIFNYQLLFANTDFYKINNIFRHNEWFKKIKRLLPFVTHFPIKKSLLTETNISHLKKNTSGFIYNISNCLWKHLQISIRKNYVTLKAVSISNEQYSIRTNHEINKKLNETYQLTHWKQHINWNVFRISGESLLNCLLQKPNSFSVKEIPNIKLYYIGTGYFQFVTEIKKWEETIKNVNQITFIKIKSSIAYKNIYIIQFHKTNAFIKIRFIYQWKTEATMVTQRSFASNQICYNANTNKILYTDAFHSFIQTGFNCIYENKYFEPSFCLQMLKYYKQNIHNIKVPLYTNITELEQSLNEQLKNNLLNKKIVTKVTINNKHTINLKTRNRHILKLYVNKKHHSWTEINLCNYISNSIPFSHKKQGDTLLNTYCCAFQKDIRIIYKSINHILND